MRTISLVLSTIIIAILLAGCSSLVSTPVATPYPNEYIPTVIALTVQAGRQLSSTPTSAVTPPITHAASPTPSPARSATSAASPSATLVPSETIVSTPTRRPSRTPTITPTPGIPGADIQISSPGPMSRVVSHIQVSAYLRTIPSGSLHIEIWAEPLRTGEDARLLYREVQNFISEPSDWIYLNEDIEFELARVSEFGRLNLSVFDQYGRPVSVSSVYLLLLSMGETELTPPGDLLEPIDIREPAPNQLIQGGTVIVSGVARPSEEYMLIELVTSDGTVVGYSQLFITPSPDGAHVPFVINVPYQVSEPTWVRLTISERGTRINGIETLASVEVLLSP
jgi:uncharacterized protein YceK